MSNELQVLEQDSNVIVEAFKIKGGAQSLFDQIAAQARSVVPDLSTDKKRKEVASLAAKVSKTKVAFDNHGKNLKEQYTVITNKIDADRKLFRDQCDALRDEIRQPLTDWENAEKDRVQAIQDKIAQFDSGRVDIGSPLSLIISVIAEIEAIEIDESFAEQQEQAKLKKYECLEVLRKVQVDREKYEAEQAELDRLRQAEQLRQQQERDAQIALEAAKVAENLAKEKARSIAERVAHERAEAEQREAKLKHEAEQALIREQQLKEQAEQQARQAEIDKALAIERAEQAAKQAEHNKQLAIQAERERIAREAEEKEEAERKALEAREADKDHKKKVCDDVLLALSKLGIDEGLGKSIIKAIHKGEIPNISINF